MAFLTFMPLSQAARHVGSWFVHLFWGPTLNFRVQLPRPNVAPGNVAFITMLPSMVS